MSFTDEEMDHLRKVKAHIEILLYEFWPWLKDATDTNYVVAGGMIAQMVQGVRYTEFSDMDVFILNQNFTQFAPRLIPFVEKRDKPNVGYINDKISGVYDIPKTRLLFDGNLSQIDIQIIETTYRTRQELIGGFDYVHCTMHYWNGKLYATPAAYRAAKNKRLIRTAHGKSQEYFSPKRYQKFIGRGYMPVTEASAWQGVSGTSPFVLDIDTI